jgi:hypothetical protein
MGWNEEFQKTVCAAVQHIKGSGHSVHTTTNSRNGEVFFTKNAQAKLKQWGLSEKDALDVYHHGSVVKNNLMVRKHNGYEIGIWFFADRVAGKAIISSAWKRRRR